MFNAIDVFFIVIIFILALIAAAKGLVKEFFGKAAVICGIAGAVIFYGRLSPYIAAYIKNQAFSNAISFLLIFVVVYLIVKIIQHLVAKIFSSEIMGGLDHSLGFLWGIAEGLTVVALLIVIMCGQPWVDFSSLLRGSFFYKIMASLLSAPASYVQGIFA